MDFDPGERAMLLEMRLLTTDIEGQEIFVGLTVEESVEYYAFTRPDGLNYDGLTWTQKETRRQRYLDLYAKMKMAQVAVVANERIARTEKPTFN